MSEEHIASVYNYKQLGWDNSFVQSNLQFDSIPDYSKYQIFNGPLLTWATFSNPGKDSILDSLCLQLNQKMRATLSTNQI